MAGIKRKQLNILGTRGIPAEHGGFETFAQHLALYLCEQGWEVNVYCQQLGTGAITQDQWQGIRRIHIPVKSDTALATLQFDWQATLHACNNGGLNLVLGYNTAIFSALYRLKGRVNLINMDGIEWRRQKWSPVMKVWFYINEWLGARLANHLIADHPQISNHLKRHTKDAKISMIPYGSDQITGSDPEIISKLGLKPNGYALVVARPEPENSILEIIQGFSAKQQVYQLVVLGHYDPKQKYHLQCLEAAGDQVVFLGAIYDSDIVNALRYFTRLYIHGHQVGGTNPSLVEAMGATNPVLAHNNPFNRWVLGGDKQAYFISSTDFSSVFDQLINDDGRLEMMKKASFEQHARQFTWPIVLKAYHKVLSNYINAGGAILVD